jgi:hypothetical protein
MAICVIEASNAFLSLLSAPLARDLLELTWDVLLSLRITNKRMRAGDQVGAYA